ncbi:MAG: SPOR domain-containing protein [Ignavibacteria bacterium]
MKNKIPGYLIFVLMLLTYAGCNSPIYEIVEVEEPVEIKEEKKSPVSEIKEDPLTQDKENLNNQEKTENKSEDSKFSEKDVVSRTYVIQIGAFNRERNAQRYYNSALVRLPSENIILKNIDGTYKLRLGNFNDKQEAINYLDKIKAAGYSDCFVLELTYVKTQK